MLTPGAGAQPGTRTGGLTAALTVSAVVAGGLVGSTPPASGASVDVNGARVSQYDDNGGTNQQWQLVKLGDTLNRTVARWRTSTAVW